MNILALDTSMGACSAALLRRDGDARWFSRGPRGWRAAMPKR